MIPTIGSFLAVVGFMGAGSLLPEFESDPVHWSVLTALVFTGVSGLYLLVAL